MSSINLSKLDTEGINSNTIDIDSATSLEIVKMMNAEDKKVAIAVDLVSEDIAKVIDMAREALGNNGRIIYLGAGNSGRTAAGDACECVPTFGVNSNTVVAVVAGGSTALVSANEGAEDNYEQGALDLQVINLEAKDIVIGLSASGRTPYVIGGLKYAQSIGCKTTSISCCKNSEISHGVDVNVEIIVGPEAITGSTRLKAGTAQKMVVNMISTGSMIGIGKVYKNYMVDVSVKNKKLHQRGKNIIKACTSVTDIIAEEYLEKSEGNVKVAIIMILKGITFEESENLLKENGHIKDLL